MNQHGEYSSGSQRSSSTFLADLRLSLSKLQEFVSTIRDLRTHLPDLLRCLAEATSLALTVSSPPANPVARRKLQALSRDKLSHLVKAYLAVAIAESQIPQRVRIGTGWLKDPNGDVAIIAPEALSRPDYVHWLGQRIFHHLIDIVADEDPLEGRQGTLSLDECPACGGWLEGQICRNCTLGVPRGTEPRYLPAPAPRPVVVPGPLDAIVAASVVDEVCKRASPRELQLLHLLADETPAADLAVLMGVSPQAVATYRARLARKAKKV